MKRLFYVLFFVFLGGCSSKSPILLIDCSNPGCDSREKLLVFPSFDELATFSYSLVFSKKDVYEHSFLFEGNFVNLKSTGNLSAKDQSVLQVDIGLTDNGVTMNLDQNRVGVVMQISQLEALSGWLIFTRNNDGNGAIFLTEDKDWESYLDNTWYYMAYRPSKDKIKLNLEIKTLKSNSAKELVDQSTPERKVQIKKTQHKDIDQAIEQLANEQREEMGFKIKHGNLKMCSNKRVLSCSSTDPATCKKILNSATDLCISCYPDCTSEVFLSCMQTKINKWNSDFYDCASKF